MRLQHFSRCIKCFGKAAVQCTRQAYTVIVCTYIRGRGCSHQPQTVAVATRQAPPPPRLGTRASKGLRGRRGYLGFNRPNTTSPSSVRR